MSRSCYVHVVHGDISQLQADAVVFPTSAAQTKTGHVLKSLEQHVPGFQAAYASARRGFDGQDAYWLPLPAPPLAEDAASGAPLKRVAGVVVGQVVRAGKPRATVESVEAVARAAVRLATEQLGGTAHLLLALPSLGAGAGAGQHLNELATAQVRGVAAALRDWLAAAPLSAQAPVTFDVVMVCFDLATRQRFNAARAAVRAELGAAWPCWEPLSADAPPDATTTDALHPLNALADRLRAEECVLFVGSGLSSGAGLPSWQALIERLLAELPEDAQKPYLAPADSPKPPADSPKRWRKLTFDDFLDIASWHRIALKHPADPTAAAKPLRSHQHHIRDIFSDDKTRHLHPTLAHYALMSMPWRHIVTTNYDALIERTLAAQRAPFQRVTTDDQIPTAGHRGQTTVIKFHGHAANPDAPTSDKDDLAIVLTRDEYEGFFKANPAKAMLLEGLLLNHHFLFYGYSLSDQDLRLIYNRVGDVLKQNRRAAFSAALGPFHAFERAFWRERGLHLVAAPDGDTVAARAVSLARWLDALLERASSTPAPLLSDAADAAPASLRGLHKGCAALGLTLDATISGLKGTDDPATRAAVVAAAEPLLDTLARLGWRPPGGSVARLWDALATASPDAADQARLRQRAYAAAQGLDELNNLRLPTTDR